MSKIKARIVKIENLENLNIVSFSFFDTTLTMMSLELKEEVQEGKEVLLNIKATTVAIAKNLSGEISYSNQIDTQILSIDMGELLCSICLQKEDIKFESIITAKSAKRLNIQNNDKVTALIKASEISIAEVLDD
jgi:molybdopterin-binding protein